MIGDATRAHRLHFRLHRGVGRWHDDTNLRARADRIGVVSDDGWFDHTGVIKRHDERVFYRMMGSLTAGRGRATRNECGLPLSAYLFIPRMPPEIERASRGDQRPASTVAMN